jgi:thioredoxin 1
MAVEVIYKTISTEEFKQKISKESEYTLIKFCASWSGNCQLISGFYSELSIKYSGKVRFYAIDIEANKTTANLFGISELPDILFFHHGELVDRIAGTVPKNVLKGKIEDLIN